MGAVWNALYRARMVAQQHMTDRVDQGMMWDERTVTDLLLSEAYKESGIRYAPFTQRQESDVGADWIWWFIDRSGECFGMLIQAKTLKKLRDGHFRIDFGYSKSRQITRLRESADFLQIPAVYALYCGDTAYRAQLACGRDCARPVCDRCEQKATSVVAALIAHHSIGYGPRMSAAQSFESSEPLETLGECPSSASQLTFSGSPVSDPDLESFLTQPQVGARGIARWLTEQIREVRNGHFSFADTDTVDLGAAVVFRDVPIDPGHFPEPYLPHVLRGLRSRPPGYVSEFLRSGRIPDRIGGVADGLVVVPI